MKSKLKTAVLFVLVAALMLSAIGCASTPPTPAASAAPSQTQNAGSNQPAPSAAATEEVKKIKIGWSVHFWNPLNVGLDEYIHEYFPKLYGGDNVDIITLCSDGDAIKQIADVEDLIAQDVDCIIIKAQDTTSCANVLAEAREKGILVVLLQRRMDHENYDWYVGADFKEVGTEMGKAVVKQFPEGNFNYCFLEGSATGANDLDIIAGVSGVFEASGLPGIVRLDGKNSQIARAEAKTITEDWLTAHGENIDVILTTADELAVGAVQAIEERNIDKTIYLTGCNAVTELLPKVQDGSVLVTFAQSPGVFPGVEIIIEALNDRGSAFAKKDYEVPVFAVTPENVGQFYDQVVAADLYMIGYLPPPENPLFENLGDIHPELLPLIDMHK